MSVILKELSVIFKDMPNVAAAVRLGSFVHENAPSRFRWLQNFTPTAHALNKLEPVVELPNAILSAYKACRDLGENGLKVVSGRRAVYTPYVHFARIAETVGVLFDSFSFISGHSFNPTVCKRNMIIADVAYATSSVFSIWDRVISEAPPCRMLSCEYTKDVLTIVGTVCSLSGAVKAAKVCNVTGDILKLYLAHLKCWKW